MNLRRHRYTLSETLIKVQMVKSGLQADIAAPKTSANIQKTIISYIYRS